MFYLKHIFLFFCFLPLHTLGTMITVQVYIIACGVWEDKDRSLSLHKGASHQGRSQKFLLGGAKVKLSF